MESIINKNDSSLKINNDSEIVEFVKETILKRHPVMDRLEVLFSPSRPAMIIDFYFYEEYGKTYTDLSFMDGNEGCKQGIYEGLIIEGLVSEKVIIEITNFLLKDHDYISMFYTNDYRTMVDFKVDMREENMHGISCGTISMNFDYGLVSNKNKKIIKHKYSKVFVSNFLDYMKHTDFYKEAYNLYTSGFKSEYFDSLDDESLYKFVKQMDKDSLKELLKEMDFERFLKTYNEMQEEYKDAPINRKLLK